jgi:Tfp pilus assembly protein PilO
MPLANLKISSKSVVTLAVVAAVFFLVDAAVYVKSSGSLQQARAELSTQENQVDNSRKVVEKLDTTERQFKALECQLTMLETSVSKAAYIPTLLKQLENSGKSVHLRVIGVRPEKAQPAPPPVVASGNSEGSTDENAPPKTAAVKKKTPTYDALKIDIEVEGSYWNTMMFLQKLTLFPKIVAVDSIQINPNSLLNKAKVSPNLSVQLSVRAFVFPEDAGVTPSATTRRARPAGNSGREPTRVSKNKWRSEHEAG